MILDPVKLMPPELVPFAQDIDAFKADTRVRLLWPPIGLISWRLFAKGSSRSVMVKKEMRTANAGGNTLKSDPA